MAQNKSGLTPAAADSGWVSPCGGLRGTAREYHLLNHQPLLSGRGLPAKAQSFRRVSPVPPPPLHPAGVLREAIPLGAYITTDHFVSRR